MDLLLTAVHQSVSGGRRAEEDEPGSDAQTAGTERRYPAGEHVRTLFTQMLKCRYDTEKIEMNLSHSPRERRRWSAV